MSSNNINRSAWTEISLDAIGSNFQTIRNLVSPVSIIATIKADAYGHGDIKIAENLDKIMQKEDSYGISTLDEGIILRNNNIKKDIVLFSPPPLKFIKEIIENKITVLISSLYELETLSKISKDNHAKINAFIAVDTGMGRIGFQVNEASKAIKVFENRNINTVGVFSHLSSADEKDSFFTNNQIKKFVQFKDELISMRADIKIATIANSAGILNYKNSHFDAVRPGLALYGYYPENMRQEDYLEKGFSLKPAMTVVSKIVHIKEVPVGTPIGYYERTVTDRKSIIGTLPLGYADGVPRNYTNGEVLVSGKRAKIIGNICMDQLMIDLTDIKAVKLYDNAIILGESGQEKITAYKIAKKSNTIPYEILVRFGQRLSKVYI